MEGKGQLIKNGWKQRIIRIKPDYIRFCSYLDYLSIKKNSDMHQFYNEIFLYSLDHIFEHGFNYVIEEYKPRRTPKGFLLEGDTSVQLDSAHEFFNKLYVKKYCRKLYIAEFVELLLYIYCMNNLTEAELLELDSLNIIWGIKKLE